VSDGFVAPHFLQQKMLVPIFVKRIPGLAEIENQAGKGPAIFQSSPSFGNDCCFSVCGDSLAKSSTPSENKSIGKTCFSFCRKKVSSSGIFIGARLSNNSKTASKGNGFFQQGYG